MPVQPIFTAHATSTGGRNGHASADDGLISVDLSVPKAMGGPGKPNTTTPEHLFAAGYAACLGGAIDYQATLLKIKPSSLEVKPGVTIGKSDDGGFGLAVELDVAVGGLSEEDAKKIVEAGHAFCPYSKAIKGNVDVKLNVTTV